MKNKFFFLGSLCLVLALGLVLFACEEAGESPAIGEVAPTFTRAIGTTDPTDPDSSLFVISWAPVEDAVDYAVFVQTQGADKAWKVDTLTQDVVTGSALSIPAKRNARYDLDGADDLAPGEVIANWAAVVDFKDFATYTQVNDAGFGRLGVMAIPYKTNKNPSIVWSEEFFTYIIK